MKDAPKDNEAKRAVEALPNPPHGAFLGGFGPEFLFILLLCGPAIFCIIVFIEGFHYYGYSSARECLVQRAECSTATAIWLTYYVGTVVALAAAFSVRGRFFSRVKQNTDRNGSQQSEVAGTKEQKAVDDLAPRYLEFSLTEDRFAITIADETEKAIQFRIERLS